MTETLEIDELEDGTYQIYEQGADQPYRVDSIVLGDLDRAGEIVLEDGLIHIDVEEGATFSVEALDDYESRVVEIETVEEPQEVTIPYEPVWDNEYREIELIVEERERTSNPVRVVIGNAEYELE